GPRAHAPARGRPRRDGGGDEPRGHGAHALRGVAGAGSGRQPPVRGAGCAGAGGTARRAVVRATPGGGGRVRPFGDRAEAGRELAAALSELAQSPRLVVLGLPRGGVPVAAEVARALGAPLDVFVVRKLGVPGRRELAMGAIATGGVRVLNREVVDALGIPEDRIAAVAAREARELERRERAYRGEAGPVDVAG